MWPFNTTSRVHASIFVPVTAAAFHRLPVLVPPPHMQRVLLLLLLLWLFKPLATTQPTA
jgi:hypothetical protein